MQGRIGAAAGVLALVGACGTPAEIPEVAEKPVIEIAEGQKAKPIQFRKIVVKLKRGEDIGSIQMGLLCVPHGELTYRGGRQTWSGDDLTEVFQDELKAANYEVVGDPDALFEDPSTWQAEYLVAGLVKELQADLCFPYSGFGNISSAKGRAFMKVDWQVYSRLRRKVVLELSTEGTSDVQEASPAGSTDVFLDAFAQATRNMLGDEDFHDLITGAAPAAPTEVAETIHIEPPPESDRPIGDRIGDVRLQVVTIFAGDGHGSGFFIDDSGHILTNEHVVRTAKFVKAKLVTGRELLGEVVSTDAARDVALIKTEKTGLTGLPLRLDAPGVGEDVYVIGSPLREDLDSTVTRGVVSAFRTEDGLEFIQSDVNVLPGNSGGPLLDGNGNVIGLTASGVSSGGVPMGLNFFVPIRDACKSLGIALDGGSG